jgi:T5orf172 domain/Domain of unknown function (DUF4268)
MANRSPPGKGGFVYIMTNQTMPGLVKIGSTKLSPEERARQLSTTGVPKPFKVIAFQRFEDELRAERELQAMFSQKRLHSRREFFETSVEEARIALLRLSGGRSDEPPPTPALSDRSRDAKGAALAGSDTNASVLGFPYWTRFNEMREKHNLLPRFERAGPRFFHRYFLTRPSQRNGKRNIHYEGRIRINPQQVSMRVIFKTAENIKELFDIVAQERDTIEQKMRFPLLWMRDRGRYESHIAIERDDMDPRDVGEWDHQHTWLSEIVTNFEKIIRPHVEKLPG